MRKNQVTIKIERTGDQVPESFSPDVETQYRQQKISVYADSNNLYEALCAAIQQVMTEIEKYENIPSFGCKESYDVSKRTMRQVR